MTALEQATIAPWARPHDDGPRPYRYDVAQFDWMRAHGFFDGRRVELLDGEAVEWLDGGERERFRMTVDQYQAMADAGLFDNEYAERVQLIDGEVIQMAAMSEPHAMSISLSRRVLDHVFEPESYVRVQMPFTTPGRSAPEPDLAVIAGSLFDQPAVRPSKAELLVEVCLSTAVDDRGRKPYLYAAAGVPEYWLLDLVTRRLEVYRRPLADPTSLFGHRYGSVTLYGEDESVSPLARPAASIRVASLMLPPNVTA